MTIQNTKIPAYNFLYAGIFMLDDIEQMCYILIRTVVLINRSGF